MTVLDKLKYELQCILEERKILNQCIREIRTEIKNVEKKKK